MTNYKMTLASALPKGEPNGLADFALVTTLHRQQIEGRAVQPRVALIVYDVADAGVDADGDCWVKLRIRWDEPVATQAGRKLAQQMLADEYAARTGQAVMPYELSALAKTAFRDLPRTIEEIDEAEERERDRMSPADELRRHLTVVHGIEDAFAHTDGGAEERHRKEHEGDALPEPLRHDAGWIGWSRADLEAAEIEADDLPGGEGGNADEFDQQGERDDDAPTLFDVEGIKAGDMPVMERIQVEHAREDEENRAILMPLPPEHLDDER